MPRSRGPNVNASLIHEVRMFAQQFFGGRPSNLHSAPFAENRTRPPVCLHPVLKCALCTGIEPRFAEFVINGFSVCVVHADKARGATNRPRFPGE